MPVLATLCAHLLPVNLSVAGSVRGARPCYCLRRWPLTSVLAWLGNASCRQTVAPLTPHTTSIYVSDIE